MYLYFIILLISFTEIFLQAGLDTWKRKKGITVKHGIETFIGIVLVIAGILVFMNEASSDIKLYSLAYYFAVRFMFYDVIYNKLNRLDTWYIGKTAMTDRLLKRLNMLPIFIVYGRMTLFSIGSLILFSKLNNYWIKI